uniref:hypothetical protein n=1 Tax=Thermoactinomyces mirandus TaxID=2756294 RepID=UPI0035E43646
MFILFSPKKQTVLNKRHTTGRFLFLRCVILVYKELDKFSSCAVAATVTQLFSRETIYTGIAAPGNRHFANKTPPQQNENDSCEKCVAAGTVNNHYRANGNPPRFPLY